ncbi:YaaA family protein [Microbacterium sp. NPDC055683]
MLVLLPPSETKRPDGDPVPLDLSRLRLPSLGQLREQAVAALVALSQDEDEAVRVLKLSSRQRGAVEVNRVLREAPTMPAVDRYTGVLYDALSAGSLDESARGWLAAHVLIQTAPLGPVGAGDAIPAYRLAAGARLPGLPPLRRHWSEATTSALRDAALGGLVVDLRSKSYVELGAVPDDLPGVYVHVVAEEDGAVRALNHFNKKAKGLLVRRMAETGVQARSVDELLAWARAEGVALRAGAHPREAVLVAAA